MGQLLVTGFRVFSPLKRSGFLMSFVSHLPLPNKRRAGPLKPCSVSLQPHSKQGLLCKEKLLDQRILTGESRHTFGQRAFQKQQLSAKSHLDKKKILPFLVNLTLLISSNTGVSFQARGRRLFSCLLYCTSASFSRLLCCHILLQCCGPGLLLLDVAWRALVSSVCWGEMKPPCALCASWG